jgi:Zn-dependent M28 family amino/carboxypeptidase
LSILLVLVSCQCPINIDVQSILYHLRQLDLIASTNGGNRAAGTSGYQASMGYIISTLQSTGLKVSTQDFTFTSFKIIGDPKLSQTTPNPRDYIYETDYRILTGSGSGVATADDVFVVPNLGCHTSDYAGFPPGAVAIIARGDCTFTGKVDHAIAAGAAAVIIYNTPGGPIFSGSVEANIPVLSVSNDLGRTFTSATKLTYNIQTLKEITVTSNIFAETTSAQTDSVVVVGSHLDSVPAGAGINDNGSGSAVNLELAITLAQCLQNPINKVRFAWWGAEELGLLGSTYYVEDLVQNNPSGLADIILNLNFDMVGSPNFFYGIYNGSMAAPEIRQRSILIQNQFEASL